eukprot:snap_masked-scaffold_41-processed-gene-0.27-mRNA-1 protein AED:1.00 eAED:1.00 QI:0/-1/0/0/-1/1/1/0/672
MKKEQQNFYNEWRIKVNIADMGLSELRSALRKEGFSSIERAGTREELREVLRKHLKQRVHAKWEELGIEKSSFRNSLQSILAWAEALENDFSISKAHIWIKEAKESGKWCWARNEKSLSYRRYMAKKNYEKIKREKERMRKTDLVDLNEIDHAHPDNDFCLWDKEYKSRLYKCKNTVARNQKFCSFHQPHCLFMLHGKHTETCGRRVFSPNSKGFCAGHVHLNQETLLKDNILDNIYYKRTWQNVPGVYFCSNPFKNSHKGRVFDFKLLPSPLEAVKAPRITVRRFNEYDLLKAQFEIERTFIRKCVDLVWFGRKQTKHKAEIFLSNLRRKAREGRYRIEKGILLYLRSRGAAIRIQKLMRGALVRGRFSQLRTYMHKEHERELAIILQAQVRGVLCRKHLRIGYFKRMFLIKKLQFCFRQRQQTKLKQRAAATQCLQRFSKVIIAKKKYIYQAQERNRQIHLLYKLCAFLRRNLFLSSWVYNFRLRKAIQIVKFSIRKSALKNFFKLVKENLSRTKEITEIGVRFKEYRVWRSFQRKTRYKLYFHWRAAKVEKLLKAKIERGLNVAATTIQCLVRKRSAKKRFSKVVNEVKLNALASRKRRSRAIRKIRKPLQLKEDKVDKSVLQKIRNRSEAVKFQRENPGSVYSNPKSNYYVISKERLILELISCNKKN